MMPAAAGESAAGRRISGRGLSPGRRRSRRRRRTDQGRQIHEDALTANGKTIGENCKGKFSWDRNVIKDYGKPLMKHAGFKMLTGNLFDQRHHEDHRDLRGIPPALSVQSERSQCLRGQGHRLRRARGLSRHDRRSEARHRREHHSLHARHWAFGLSGCCRSRQHARPHQASRKGRALAALRRRRPPVRHLGLAVDSQCLAGSGGGRRSCHVEEWRPGADRSQ